MNVSLSASVYALSGAGKEALLEVLPESLSLPGSRCLCLIDARRMEDGSQANLLSEVTKHARERGMRPIFVLTNADHLTAPRAAMARLLGRLKDLGWTSPEVWPVCAEAARLFLLPTRGRELSEAEQAAVRDTDVNEIIPSGSTGQTGTGYENIDKVFDCFLCFYI